ncbi:hypothetical protein ZYGR_0BA00110 [Zygosaccharomyces rouxii]|uniref:Uncharacterized protein n=1 Tax=Zygosaccharomyces rouxii TaxID=4956 RepID=A0A1Q3AKD2_ZYGRO|nr:hypothetical protein ZYGR_0BA00110 [Zygosaccharomyces rouxii]
MIDAILTAANPDQATPKRIRKALQELFGVDLDSRRKEVNKIIVERFQESQDCPKKLVSVEQLSKQDESTARRLVKGSNKKRGKSGNNDSNPKKKRSGESTGGFNKTRVLIAEPLCELLGESESTRTQVVKSVWDYIKRNNLQNPNDRREILCDDRMKPIFGEKVTMFSMNKALAKYIHNAPDGAPAPTYTNSSSPPVVKDEAQDNNQAIAGASNHNDDDDDDDDDDDEEEPATGEHETSEHEQEESNQDEEAGQDEEEEE